MANDNKNSKELVAEDIAELDAATFPQDQGPTRKAGDSDENTFNLAEYSNGESKKVRKLRYDVEQLRSRWMGLEAELRAREEITDTLNAEICHAREALARKEKLIKSRDAKIKALKTEIREREAHHRDTVNGLQAQLDQASKAPVDITPPAMEATPHMDPHGLARRQRIEEYTDLLRRKLQDQMAQYDDIEKDNRRLTAALARADERARVLNREVSELNFAKQALEEQLSSIEARHAEEIRMLRFELGEAQETVAQTEVLNTQLASDLVDTRGFKEELERMLCDTDEQSRSRIDELENEVEKLQRDNKDLEEKVEARSDAINVLLSELARKSEQIESINELGDVISDIDGRMTEQFDEVEELPPPQRSPDRVTRVLLGKAGDKLLRFPLFKDRLTIGRTEDNDIQLNLPYVSRRHAVVTTDGETTRVIDWGSKNGVFVNSERVTEHFLSSGDVLTIGTAHFRYDERAKRDS